jgi:hypothetical protein
LDLDCESATQELSHTIIIKAMVFFFLFLKKLLMSGRLEIKVSFLVVKELKNLAA